jgi:LmbE family N-acetylglucosaminyl deacetylase
MKRILIIVPHLDDEVLMCGSVLTNVNADDICIFYTHLYSVDYFNVDKENHKELESKLNDYRKSKNLKEIRIITPYNPQEYESYINYYDEYGNIKNIPNTIKKLNDLISSNKIDTIFYPIKSIHQNHRESYEISKSVLRDPYVKDIKFAFECFYPINFSSPYENDIQFPNYFIPMSSQDLNFICNELLNKLFIYKINPDSSISKNNFKRYIIFFSSMYYKNKLVQPFILKRGIYDNE